jgi:membrane protein DedA with SNARE-associated domain
VFPEFQDQLAHFVMSYGYGVVALVVALESMGLPLPGETTLVVASIYAGNTHRLSIQLVILAGIAGAIIGDNIGYWIGREAGLPLLARHGRRVGLTDARLRLGRYLFLRHGGKVVFFGRFIAILRALAGVLAGALHMEWYRFLAFNVMASIVWVGSYSLAAYLLGSQIEALLGPVGIAVFLVAATVLALGTRQLRRNQARLQAEADARFPEAAALTE